MLVEVNPGEFLCWKVCQIDPHAEYTKFVSSIIDDPTYQVEYEINHWIGPKYTYTGYGLLAFSNFNAARRWCDRSVGQVVFEGLGRNRLSTKKFPKRVVLYSGYHDDWHTLITSLGGEIDGKWPTSTVMFGEIKILERVWG